MTGTHHILRTARNQHWCIHFLVDLLNKYKRKKSFGYFYLRISFNIL